MIYVKDNFLKRKQAKMYKLKQIDVITYSIILDKLDDLSKMLYNENINPVEASFQLDKIIEELKNNMTDATKEIEL